NSNLDAVDMQSNGTLERATISDTSITAGLSGIIVDAALHSHLHDLTINQPGEHGISLTDSDENRLHDITIIHPGQDGDNTYDGVILTTSDNNYLTGITVISDTGNV